MNTDLLIEMVKQRSSLFDAKDPLFKDKKDRELKWGEIATAMDVAYHVAKNRWRNLKDCYCKHLKSLNNPKISSTKYTYWQWSKKMAFMKPHLKFSLAVKNTKEEINQANVVTCTSIPNCQTSTLDSRQDGDLSMSNQNGDKTSILEQNLKIPSERINIKSKVSDFDATELIFLGYAKSVKSFSLRKQAEVKLKIAQVIMEEEIAHLDEIVPDNPIVYTDLSSC